MKMRSVRFLSSAAVLASHAIFAFAVADSGVSLPKPIDKPRLRGGGEGMVELARPGKQRSLEEVTVCQSACSDELETCLGASDADDKKCNLYAFECRYLCENTSVWTCEDHCQSDYQHCLIAEEGVGCIDRRDRCISCCPTATPTLSPKPTWSSPTTSPTSSPITAFPSSKPTKGPTASPSHVPTNPPTVSHAPTMAGGAAQIGVPIYPDALAFKKVKLPQSSEGILFKLTKRVGADCEGATSAPVSMPTASPTKPPTFTPSTNPTYSPTPNPTAKHSATPSLPPTHAPTPNPTAKHSDTPSLPPTPGPTPNPTYEHTDSPTGAPLAVTVGPTSAPATDLPTNMPVLTSEPTLAPESMEPTSAPLTEMPTPMPADTLEYILLPGNEYDKCPNGQDVSQSDCLQAGNSLTEHLDIENEENMYVADWNGLPCGCFIYDNRLIDYDTNCGNKATSTLTQLVCTKSNAPAPTSSPGDAGSGYVLLPGSEYDKCPPGQEVPQDQCLGAANTMTADRNTISNTQTLTVHDWNFTPCGCFVWDNMLLDFDTNCLNSVKASQAELVCKDIDTPTAPTSSPVHTSSGYILLPGIEYDKCPPGQEVPQDQCLDAANTMTADRTTISNTQTLTVHDWNFTPCGCFVWNNMLLDFDTNCLNSVKSSQAELVCKDGTATQRALSTEDTYYLLSANDNDRCPPGQEVPQDQCLAAANSVTQHLAITNGGNLHVNDWGGLPCGCFIYNNQLIDYDFNCENSFASAVATLVCKEPGPTSLPTPVPTTVPTPVPPKLFPAGRSYDGNTWESTHPLLLSYSCLGNKQCTVDLPPEECDGIYYMIEKYEPEPLSAEQEASRLLIQATFGPTQKSINDAVNNYTSARDWIKDQMDEAVTPLSLHREHYRKRSNSHVRQGLEKFGLRKACDVGSRWNRWAFNRYRDVGKQIFLEATASGTFLMEVDGIPRTEVPGQPEITNQNTFFNRFGALYICRGMSDMSSLPEAKLVLANSPENCDMANQVGHIHMPSVEFNTVAPSSLGLNIPDVTLDEVNPAVLDVKLLSSSLVPCNLKKSWPNFVRDSISGLYYMEDRRVEFLDMDPASISGMGLSTKTCPSAPKTFLNEDSCVIRSDCTPPVYQASSGSVLLNAENLRNFYHVGGHYVYRVSGLPIITDPLSRYEMISPCNDAITYKRFDWTPFRFVRKNAPHSFCSPASSVDSTVMSIISGALAEELAKTSDLAQRNDKRVLDVVMPKNACSDPFKTAMGASFNVYDSTSGTTTCWTHSHDDEWSVYNFDQWTLFHPGNVEAHTKHKKNPIADFAESENNGNLEDSVTIVMPSWHPSDRFQDTQKLRDYIGNYGDWIAFDDLHPSVQGTEMADFFGAVPSPNSVQEYIQVCASPGEVSNDPSLGHQYRLQKGGDTGFMDFSTLDQDGFGWNQKNRVWNTVSMFAKDQLRQRVAWVLSSIFVVTAVDINTEMSVEPWSSYTDIFVRNAFGNFFDVMKEVSFHPLMAKMLTYHKSRSMSYNFEKDGVMLFPDENYAREIMQLFSIGLYKLNQDGTKIMNEMTGEPAETYTNEDIMTFSRAWTNFQRREERPNIEVFSDMYFFDNELDPMELPTTDGRDVFPKLGLDDGGRVYIGDKVKRCDEMPSASWLRKGAKYVFRGSNPNLDLGRKDPSSWDDYPDHSRIILDGTSNLYAALCNANPVTGACQFMPTVILPQNLECVGTCSAVQELQDPQTDPCECSIDEPRTVRVDDPTSVNGNPPSVWYEYVRDACVQIAFPEQGQMKAVSEIGNHWGEYSNEAMCADARLAVAGGTCCDPSNNFLPHNICIFRGERTTYSTAKQRCEDNGLVTCPWSQVPISFYCGTDIEWWGEHEAAGMRFSWTNEDCDMKVQINERGYIAMVHEVGSLSQEVKGRVKVDVGTYFRVLWEDDAFPTLGTCGDISGCQVQGQTCLCSTTVQTTIAFDGSTMPTKEEVLSELHIGASDPDQFDVGTYHECSAPLCASISSEFVLHFTQVVESNSALAQAMDKSTIFELSDPLTGEKIFLSNTRSAVGIGSGFSFRNPPMFNSPIDQTQRDALYETDAVLKHYSRHSNTAPFISMRLIQHLISSNPSPRYVSVVSEAFRKGTYNGFGSGRYGDLEAAIAAVFLDDEARSATLDADSTNGRAREPLLKILHIFRAMEMGTSDGREREIDMDFMKDKIGQESHYAPSVFSFFLPEYQPVGPVFDLGLVAPETQLYDAPKLIGLINGLTSVSNYGINDCEDGKNFGNRLSRYAIPDHFTGGYTDCYSARFDLSKQAPHRLRWLPLENSSPEEVVDQMDLLLTGGRLSSSNKEIIVEAYANKVGSESEATALQYAVNHFSVAPEFQVTNHLFTNETELKVRTVTVPELIPDNPPPVTDYKAIVYLYLAGALDSFNLLMPYTCSNNLNLMYHQVRGHLAINNNFQLPISAGSSPQHQPCSTFGIHPNMGLLQQLYNSGEASFVANIGPLAEPIQDKNEFESGIRDIPPSLFAHNIQTGETQGVATGDAKAGGILGRIGDALNSQAGEEIFDAYSIAGTPKALEGAPGVSRPADVLTEVGVSTFIPAASELEGNIQDLNKYVADSIYAETFSDSISTTIARKNLLDGAIGTSELSSATENCFKNIEHLETSIALQFKQVARIMKQRNSLQSKRDVFYLQLGGFDAHGGDTYTALLLSEINSALGCFVNDMKAEGLWNDVTVMSASEFGRTLTSNGAGSDHAWAGNHFLMGGSISGGKIHGQYPDDLTDAGPLNIGRGRLIPTTPWEGVWKGIAEWFGVENGNMADVLPNLDKFHANIFGKDDLYKFY